MSRWDAYLNSASRIISVYGGEIPLSAWLKSFFAKNRQMGATDRRWISDAVYTYYRLGHSAKGLATEERILTAVLLCNTATHPLLHHLRRLWDDAIALPLSEKLSLLRAEHPDVGVDEIFPWHEDLSPAIDKDLFNLSFLRQPDVFLRIRPGHTATVLSKLQGAKQPFAQIDDHCLALPNGTKIDQVLQPDIEIVVQDYSSQRTGAFLPLNDGPVKLWDCCAASGGKSIMAYDMAPAIDLTVSDIRDSILHNLRKRFQTAGIRNYRSFTANLGIPVPDVKSPAYDLILADLPCSGSGTWARTPEQLHFFQKEKISQYSDLQKNILLNVVPQLRSGGSIVYITCSVFRKENEDIVEFVKEAAKLQLEEMEILKGYPYRADSMFVARMRKG